jgi:hypothetical protein
LKHVRAEKMAADYLKTYGISEAAHSHAKSGKSLLRQAVAQLWVAWTQDISSLKRHAADHTHLDMNPIA